MNIEEKEEKQAKKKKKSVKKISIELSNVSKRFVTNSENQGFWGLIFGSRRFKEFLVLDDISLKIKEGENLGIIGKNGSGKTTLLKIISGEYDPGLGRIMTEGKVVYLTGLGRGLRPGLTMKENIFESGFLFGLSEEKIQERFDEIVEFSGLGDYLNLELENFSSGMMVRLASAIGLHCVSALDPDILLIDEVIGKDADINYQEKALKKIEELLKSRASVVLVSHDLDIIKKHGDKAIWLNAGKIVEGGKSVRVVKAYQDSNKKAKKKESKKKQKKEEGLEKIKEELVEIKEEIEEKEYF